MTEIGAIVFRRSSGFWCIDEFDWTGRYLGSSSANHNFPRITGWRTDVSWPKEPTPLRSLSKAPFAGHAGPDPAVRKGLVRCIDGAAQRRAA